MRKPHFLLLLASCLVAVCVASAQQVCPGLPYVANTPEDELMQAVNGAENPQEQIAALDKFAQDHGDSRFMPCVDEYYTIANLKLNNYDKVIEYGEKGLSGNYQDVMLMLNTVKAYVASGKVSDKALEILLKAPDVVKAETTPSKPPNVSDAEWQKTVEEYKTQGDDQRAYFSYAFFQLLPRVTDPNKQIEYLDQFSKTYPDAETKNAAQINFGYFKASLLSNKLDKAVEYGEKGLTADANNVEVLNTLAYIYAHQSPPNLDKADTYATKVVAVVPNMKKPEGVADDAFKKETNNQLGWAHLTLGFVNYQRAAKTRKVAPAIQEFKTAADLLEVNPALQGEALYLLGSAYEFIFPANHHGAIEALTKAAEIPGNYQAPAKDLLAKVKRVAKE